MALLGMGDNSLNVQITTKSDKTGINETKAGLHELDASAGSSSRVLGVLGAAAKVAAVALVAAGTALAVTGVSAVKQAAEYEQSRVSFETMLGSAQKAGDMLKDITSFATTTPFEVTGLVASTKQLLAYGFAQNEIIPTMRKLGDLAAGLNVPLDQIALAYGQVRVKGHLAGQETLQFMNAGIPITQQLAKVLGKTTDEIVKMQEKGEISFANVSKAIDSMTGAGSQFGGMMEKQSHTFSGVVSNIKDGFGNILRSAAGITATGEIIKGSLFDRLKEVAEKAMPMVSDAAEKVGPIMEKVIGFIDNMAARGKILADQVGGYLGPKFDALMRTLRDDLAPILRDIWHNIIEPLMPVIGSALVLSIGLAMDAVNFLVSAFSSLWQMVTDGNPIIWGLVGLFGALAVAMAIKAGIAAFSAAMTLIQTVIIPETMAKVVAFRALVASPMVMGALGVGAAIAAIALVKSKLDEFRADFTRTVDQTTKAAESQAAAIKQLRDLARNGTPEQKARSLDALKRMGFAEGGFTGRGGKNEVAGIVHKGEFVLPQSMVNQQTGMPKQLAGSTVTNTFTGNIILGSADAVARFFQDLNNDSILASKGLTVRQGI